ncbi:ribosomal protein S18-alanine N-acetyltransferase [Egicoccus sp. AB-alg6-2]|uniref:ribosomal protein S18-alanine N-acetyltransferase n=1 Tax=Egicoccus sp. AB-alg6-2 TaxID=3242692 RepID=UPI00359E6639
MTAAAARDHGSFPHDVEVVPAMPADADAVRALPGLGDSTRRLVDADLGRDDRCCLVARTVTSHLIVGFAAGLLALDEGHVLDVAVATDHRRRGVGARLVDELIRRLHTRGAAAVTLEVRRSNEAALSLYRQLGFVVEGVRPRYYPDGEDALLMWKRDLPKRGPVMRTEES